MWDLLKVQGLIAGLDVKVEGGVTAQRLGSPAIMPAETGEPKTTHHLLQREKEKRGNGIRALLELVPFPVIKEAKLLAGKSSTTGTRDTKCLKVEVLYIEEHKCCPTRTGPGLKLKRDPTHI